MLQLRLALLIAAFSVSALVATAYAEGWYLLAPPWRTSTKENEEEFDIAAPLTRWDQKGGFDSARLCENARLRLIEMFEKGDKERLESAGRSYMKSPAPVDPLQTKEGQEYLRWTLAAKQVRLSRCVSISDPRLR
jgi:hypothetical protein